MPKKKRSRSHIIADLSVNHVERFIFLSGYSVERVEYDYGFDLIVFTYDANGEIENGQIYLQLKATDTLRKVYDQSTIALALQKSDLELWLREPMPCILIVYDAGNDRAYWLYLQAYFEHLDQFSLARMKQTITVHIPMANILNQESVQRFAEYRDKVISQIRATIHHDF